MKAAFHPSVRRTRSGTTHPAPSTTLVSLDTTGQVFSALNTVPSISADGRWIVFATSDDLTSGSATGAGSGQNVYVKDLQTGHIELVSGGLNSQPGNQFSGPLSPAVISADGRYVVFDSNASNLVSGDTNRERDLFIRDRVTGVTSRLSIASDGSQLSPNTFQDLYSPSVSADGRFVAFEVEPSNLVTGLTLWNGIVVRDQQQSTTTLVSVNNTGTPANGPSSDPTISGDGRYVAFQSTANNLAGPAKRFAIGYDTYVRDRLTGTTELISASSSGERGNNESFRSSISSDGRYVAFDSIASNLVPGDTNNTRDVFVRDRVTGTTTRISVATDGSEGNGVSELGFVKPAISADGRYVVFQSLASNLVAGDTNNAADVFLRDRVAGTTTRISVSSGGVEASGGDFGTFSGDGTVTANGSVVLFVSNGANLAPGSLPIPLIYLRTLQSAGAPLPGQPTAPGSSLPTPTQTGTNGRDRLIGTNRRDVLSGLGGNDTLNGKNSSDVLAGGAGSDRLTGGRGRDQFFYSASNEGRDVITDFELRRDRINLSALLDQIPTSGSGNPIASRQIRLVQRGENTQINLDLNGASTGGLRLLVTVNQVSPAELRNAQNFIF